MLCFYNKINIPAVKLICYQDEIELAYGINKYINSKENKIRKFDVEINTTKSRVI
tara:strand:- start:462 stop:626 length:165 start_codon:yes stop_codon:yes gene_type:complete